MALVSFNFSYIYCIFPHLISLAEFEQNVNIIVIFEQVAGFAKQYLVYKLNKNLHFSGYLKMYKTECPQSGAYWSVYWLSTVNCRRFSGAVLLWRKATVQQQQLKCLASFHFLFPTVAVSMWWLWQTDYTHSRPNSYLSVEHPRVILRHLGLNINLAHPCYCAWMPHLSAWLWKMNISQPKFYQNYRVIQFECLQFGIL